MQDTLVMLVAITGVKMNDSARLIKKFAGRKGGRRKVPKGFAKTLTSEKAREYANRRWQKVKVDTNPTSE